LNYLWLAAEAVVAVAITLVALVETMAALVAVLED
jgi:hypothetical protein